MGGGGGGGRRRRIRRCPAWISLHRCGTDSRRIRSEWGKGDEQGGEKPGTSNRLGLLAWRVADSQGQQGSVFFSLGIMAANSTF